MTLANAKPDLLLTGPLGNSTVNAASSAWHDVITIEAKITAAIAYAVSVGAKYCYVPDSFLPYTASQVTFNAAVHMIREGGPPPSQGWDVRAYGAAGNDATDDTVAVQAAITAAGTAGGEFVLFEGLTYKITSPGLVVSFATVLQGTDVTATQLHYTSTTGTCLTFNYSTFAYAYGPGIRDIVLTGPGSGTATTGLLMGGNLGAQGTYSQTFQIKNFGTGLAFSTNSFIQTYLHGVFVANGRQVDFSDQGTNSGEGIKFYSCDFANSGTVAGAFYIHGPSWQVLCYGCSFDNTQIQIDTGSLSMYGFWAENPGVAGTYDMYVQNGGDAHLCGGQWVQDDATATASQFANISAGVCLLEGHAFQGAAAGKPPRAILAQGTSKVTVLGTRRLVNVTQELAIATTGFAVSMGSLQGFGLGYNMSADRGDASVTLTWCQDFPVQAFNTALTTNRVVTLANAASGPP